MSITEMPRRWQPPAVAPAVPRWTPTRAGILNVWRYFDEVFEFHGGRLLLRGPNGTGKSKALELLLPFLFDASLRASRLSTFGTGERTMHWNLMGEGAGGVTRVGFVWLEFRLGKSDEWFTCGARLSATSRSGSAHADYFTTDLRVAADQLSLVTTAGTPLTKGSLEERLGASGVVHPSAAEYRSAVRATLFGGLPEQRYDALIMALLQLRTPKLSQRLDPALLSTLLSSALPPLGAHEMHELAEGFERLDRRQEQLKALDREVAAARALHTRQRTYAQRVLRAAAASLISARTTMDARTRSLRAAEQDHDRLTADQAEVEAQVTALGERAESVQGMITGLEQSEAYRQGRELDTVRQQVRAARQQAIAARARADGSRASALDDKAALDAATGAAAVRLQAMESRATDAAHAATRADLASVFSELSDGVPLRQGRLLVRAAIKERHALIGAVRDAIARHARRVEARRAAEVDVDAARGALASARERRGRAARLCDNRRDELSDAVRLWATACRELVFEDAVELAGLVDSEPELIEHVERAAAATLQVLTRDETTLEGRQDEIRGELSRTKTELDRLAQAHEIPPEPPPARTTDRRSLDGAPLWSLIRFGDDVLADLHGPIEAALAAAGLLDAWVGHDGRVEGHDVFVDTSAVGPAPGRSLADVLVPEERAGVPEALVARVLACVAFDEHAEPTHPVAIGADGSWRLGNLRGTWWKARAEHIGASARERARLLRIAELTSALNELARSLRDVEGRLAVLGARRESVAAERRSRPPHGALDDARRELTASDAAVDAEDGQVRRRMEQLREREVAVADASRALTTVAAMNRMPTDLDALGLIAAVVDEFGESVEAWFEARHEHRAAAEAVIATTRAAERSATSARVDESEAESVEARHRTEAGRLDAIESAIGAEYRDLLTRLENHRAELEANRADSLRRQGRLIKLAGEIGEVVATLARRTEDGEQATAARDVAANRFRHLARGHLPADGELPDLGQFRHAIGAADGVQAALDGARLVAAAWSNVTHQPANVNDALHRLSEQIHAARDDLGERTELLLEPDADVHVFTALVNGVRVGAAELVATLRDEAARSRQEITAQERELFDRTLTGDTRRHIAARIRQANELVSVMNTRLEQVRTASDVAVKLVWRVTGDVSPGTSEARDLLLKDPAQLRDSDREALHRFFRERIDEARARETAGSWEQQLAEVFDYTAWHRFEVQVDRGGAGGPDWKILTKKLHGALSGGEKAIVLHLPLFAAVAAHYEVVPEAPRLILLDEVFVGVDSKNRGQVFALLAALDLDLVLTSDHEWCTYRELDGIAIHQLIAGSDDDAVTSARFVWNGSELRPADMT